MPPVKGFRIPDWANPDNASVLDSPLQKAARTIGQFLGINDPQSQIMGLATAPIDVPGPSQTIRAFHGSPHDFERFDLSKIGTGEGAQAYGHGLYFAENPNVAAGYREMHATKGTRVRIDGKDLYQFYKENTFQTRGEQRAIQRLIDDGDLSAALRNSGPEATYPDYEAHGIIKDWSTKHSITTPPVGHGYEVNIHASPDELLDWDKPLSQQPQKVQEALNKAWLAHPEAHANMTGAQIYEATVRDSGGRVGHTEGIATQKLKDAGIKGIQYLDQGSRAAGQGTRNFVIFDDKIIEIAKKYGISLPAAASLYKTWQQYGAPDEKGVK